MGDYRRDYEAEYNNRDRVPEHPDIIAGWARDAAAYRAHADHHVDHEADIAYGDAPRQSYDLFAVGGNDKPTVLFIHGGYWQALDKSYFSHMAAGMNARGFDVAIPSYRLCPAVRIGDIIEDMRALVRHLAGRGRTKIVASGHSAGGHLAACLLATPWDGRSNVTAALPISGLFDLAPLVETTLNEALGMDMEEAEAQSPVAWAPPAGRHLRAFVGSAESREYHRQSRTIATRWSNAGVNADWQLIDNANHFTVIASLADADGILSAALDGLARA